jgi:protein ImuA
MSPSGGAEAMARLRRAIAEIEAEAGPVSDRLARRTPLARAFDSALGGGLADDALHEIAPAEPQDGAAAMGFALALAARFLSRRPVSALLIGEGFASQEWGGLYGPGLINHGLSLSRLVFVRAPDAALAFWAIEEALKCGAPGVVIGEIWSLKGYSLAASRRLLLAARKGKVPAILVLASACGQAERISSAAETRFEIAAAPSARTSAAAGPDIPGPFACGARLLKARFARAGPTAAPLQAFDRERVVRLEWRSQDLTFEDMIFKDAGVDDQAIPFSLASASRDRSRAAARRY